MQDQSQDNPHNRPAIYNVMLFGTLLVVVVITILLGIRYSMNPNVQVLGRLGVCTVALLYIVASYLLLRRNHYRSVAYLILLFYTVLASGIVWRWGINTPIAPLMFGLVIVLAGMFLAARHGILAAIMSGSILIGVQTASVFKWHQPNTAWSGNVSDFGDVLAYCTMFSMLALVSWLYNRQIEYSLAYAKRAELALLQQKATLKLQVKKRTAELRRSQLKEMQQMYRFAELGQLGVTLVHDLANHLTALTLEIEGLQSKHHSKAIARARQIIQYLGKSVDSTRDRLQGGTQQETFNILRTISDTIAFLQYKASKADVSIEWQRPARSWTYVGDPASLSQVVAIIVSNAIDAYGTSSSRDRLSKKRRVVITAERSETHIVLKISDWGKGITTGDRKHLFKPFRSTKKSGLGIGLFIARQTLETTSLGSIALNSRSDHTEFIIKLPFKGDDEK